MAHDTVPMESSIYSIKAYIEGSDPVRLSRAMQDAKPRTAPRRGGASREARRSSIAPYRHVARWRGCAAWMRGVGCTVWGAAMGAQRRGQRWGSKRGDSSGNGFSLTFFLVAARIGCVFGVETVSGRAFRSGFPCFFIILLRFVFSANGVTRHGYQHEFRERA